MTATDTPPQKTDEFPDDIQEAGHTSLPIRVPALTHLTNQELAALREKVAGLTRKARKEASKTICKDSDLKARWLATLAVGADKEQTLLDFEAELLKHPDAFVQHGWANALFSLEQAFRTEMLRRSVNVPTRSRR